MSALTKPILFFKVLFFLHFDSNKAFCRSKSATTLFEQKKNIENNNDQFRFKCVYFNVISNESIGIYLFIFLSKFDGE